MKEKSGSGLPKESKMSAPKEAGKMKGIKIGDSKRGKTAKGMKTGKPFKMKGC